jgi:hypothetical protein
VGKKEVGRRERRLEGGWREEEAGPRKTGTEEKDEGKQRE